MGVVLLPVSARHECEDAVIFLGRTTSDGRIVPEFPAQQHAWIKRHLPAGTCIEYEVREQRSKRSDRQNRALHALLADWSRARGWTVDDLKDVMLGIAFGHLERVMPVTGEVVKVLAKPHSSQLNVTDFCHLIEEVLRVAAEDDHWLESPDEYRRAKAQAEKVAARKHAKAA